jgi:hypothetical protein
MTRLAPRNTQAPNPAAKPVDWLHWATVMVVFSITGTISMLFSRVFLGDVLHLDGNVWSGPWSYRIAYLLLITPLYSVTLVAVGTLLGKQSYFKKRVLRMWGRLLPRRMRNLSIGVGKTGP